MSRPENFMAGQEPTSPICLKGIKMALDRPDPLRDLNLQEAIDLRWTLRDVRARRWKLSPLKLGHLERLLALGLIEMQGEDPVLTEAGRSVID